MQQNRFLPGTCWVSSQRPKPPNLLRYLNNYLLRQRGYVFASVYFFVDQFVRQRDYFKSYGQISVKYLESVSPYNTK